MKHLVFENHDTYSVAILVPEIKKADILSAYLEPFGVPKEDTLVLDLFRKPGKGKTPVKEIKAYIEEEIVPVLKDKQVQYVAVADSEYFKILAKQPKAEANLGYIMDSPYGDFKVVYVPNYAMIFYDPPKVKAKIALGMQAMVNHAQGNYEKPGSEIIKFAEYPHTYEGIKKWLDRLLEMDCDLTSDIEGFSLKHFDAGIGSITFCWNQHEGIAFPVDYKPTGTSINQTEPDENGNFGIQVRNEPIRKLLKEFLIKHNAKGRKIIWHNISYDVNVLIFQLFMGNIIDTEGLLTGMKHMLSNWDCTKLISYLATNSCAGNKLGLKEQAQEFAGNYAVEEIKDIRRIPLPTLLEYNLVDGLSTWYTYNKNWPKVVKDDQVNIYREIFQPAILDIVQMQLTGMPINMAKVKQAEINLTRDQDEATARIQSSVLVQEFVHYKNEDWVHWKNSTLKKKRVTILDAKEEFNPNSPIDLAKLLFTQIGLPILELTDTKEPATGRKVLENLRNHTTDQKVLDLLSALIDYKSVAKILSAFIPAMLNAQQGPDGWHYLFGNFNLGGTVSGRLSSSDPNLQNLPAGSRYAKAIKECFEAPPGWIFVGLDFDSLEDKISALTTKDPNKLKVYTDGYDGHSLRAFFYFREEMPDIEDNLKSINSIAKLYPAQRQKSKAPTFALTYQGTFATLIKNCGFSEAVAKMIEERYHVMYAVSDQWVQAHLFTATQTGYVTAAFGLRVRTPLLHQVVIGNSKTPSAAAAEGRTAGNALGQSWCLLNNRAGSEFMGKVRASKHRLDIRPTAQIHDASYYLVREDIAALTFTNVELVKAVQWQEHPDIQHDEVKLGGKLSVFFPDWNGDIEIPNGAEGQMIIDTIHEALEERTKKAKK